MVSAIRKIRPYARTLGQILHDPAAETDLDEQVRLTKKASRILTHAGTTAGFAGSLFALSNLRADRQKILLFGRNAAITMRLKQKQPSLKRALEEAGMNQALEIRNQPRLTRLVIGGQPAQGPAREACAEAAESIRKSAAALSDSALKTAALRLAQALTPKN